MVRCGFGRGPNPRAGGGIVPQRARPFRSSASARMRLTSGRNPVEVTRVPDWPVEPQPSLLE